MRTGFDAVTVANLPDNGDCYFAYLDGGYANSAQVLARFPGRKLYTVTVNGSTIAHIGDCENGDLTPEGAAREVRAGRVKAVYMNSSTWPDVESAMGGMVPPGGYWVADYLAPGSPPPIAIPADWAARGCNAWQWSTGNYDTSIVVPVWPALDTSEEDEDDMIWGSDHMTLDERIVDGRNAMVRAWWHAYRGGEVTVQQQQEAYQVWAEKGGDLCLAAVIDGTIK